MANTYTKIASYTVSTAGVTAINFSSIPQTYTDLVCQLSTRGSSAAIFDYTTFALNNGVSAEVIRLQGVSNGAPNSGRSAGTSNFIINGANATANVFSSSEVYMPNYTSTLNKSLVINTVTENNGATSYQELNAVWYNQGVNPINFIQITGTTYAINTVATLYGIKNTA